jgi:hypothetical protein
MELSEEQSSMIRTLTSTPSCDSTLVTQEFKYRP